MAAGAQAQNTPRKACSRGLAGIVPARDAHPPCSREGIMGSGPHLAPLHLEQHLLADGLFEQLNHAAQLVPLMLQLQAEIGCFRDAMMATERDWVQDCLPQRRDGSQPGSALTPSMLAPSMLPPSMMERGHMRPILAWQRPALPSLGAEKGIQLAEGLRHSQPPLTSTLFAWYRCGAHRYHCRAHRLHIPETGTPGTPHSRQRSGLCTAAAAGPLRSAQQPALWPSLQCCCCWRKRTPCPWHPA